MTSASDVIRVAITIFTSHTVLEHFFGIKIDLFLVLYLDSFLVKISLNTNEFLSFFCLNINTISSLVKS